MHHMHDHVTDTIVDTGILEFNSSPIFPDPNKNLYTLGQCIAALRGITHVRFDKVQITYSSTEPSVQPMWSFESMQDQDLQEFKDLLSLECFSHLHCFHVYMETCELMDELHLVDTHLAGLLGVLPTSLQEAVLENFHGPMQLTILQLHEWFKSLRCLVVVGPSLYNVDSSWPEEGDLYSSKSRHRS